MVGIPVDLISLGYNMGEKTKIKKNKKKKSQKRQETNMYEGKHGHHHHLWLDLP